MTFYNKFLLLCEQKGVSRSKALLDMGMSKATGVRWRNGTMPSGDALLKVCEYFGVSMLYFTDTEVEPDVKDPNLRSIQTWLKNASEEDLKKLADIIMVIMPEITEDKKPND